LIVSLEVAHRGTVELRREKKFLIISAHHLFVASNANLERFQNGMLIQYEHQKEENKTN